MNTRAASPVMPDMRFHRQNGLPGAPAGQQDHTTDPPVRRRWRPGRRRERENAPQVPGTGGARGQTASADIVPGNTSSRGTIPGDPVAAAMQLAIGLLTASLDSAELQAWAIEALTPNDADGVCDVMAGLHMICELMLHELNAATGEPPSAILQRLAMLAEHRRGTPAS